LRKPHVIYPKQPSNVPVEVGITSGNGAGAAKAVDGAL
jgi:hypothetical protein